MRHKPMSFCDADAEFCTIVQELLDLSRRVLLAFENSEIGAHIVG